MSAATLHSSKKPLLVRLRRYDCSRFGVPSSIAKRIDGGCVRVCVKGYTVAAKVAHRKLYIPKWLSSVLGDELWVWFLEDEGMMVEYRGDPQVRLTEYELTPFSGIPSCNMPRYRSAGYCSRCCRAYPRELDRCPVCGLLLRKTPRHKKAGDGGRIDPAIYLERA